MTVRIHWRIGLHGLDAETVGIAEFECTWRTGSALGSGSFVDPDASA